MTNGSSKIRFYLLLLVACQLARTSTSKAQGSAKNGTQAQRLSLNCQAGEQRFFSYESTTKIWASSDHSVRLQANLRLRCMNWNSSDLSTSSKTDQENLKYLIEVINLNAQTIDRDGKNVSESRPILGGRADPFSGKLQAEPLLEEVGEAISEAATRMRRSVSGWFNKAWSSFKDFFTNIFTSSDRSQISRDQVLNDYGIDISSQCRASSKRKSSAGLPIDDSYFDDLDSVPDAKFYISPSLDPSTKYDMFDTKASTLGDDEDENNERYLSFFNDPQPRSDRSKRDLFSVDSSKKRQVNFDKAVKIPFVFIQSAQGKIVEIQFASDDTDVAVRNFKRHLCDLFATNLGVANSKGGKPMLRETDEVSPIGEHSTKYLLDPTNNSSAIRQVLKTQPKMEGNDQFVKNFEKLEQEAGKFRAQVAALTGSKASGSDPLQSESGQSESRATPNGEFSISVLRTINTTSPISQAAGSRLMEDKEPSIDEMQVDVRQVQQISDGRLLGTTGHLSMSLISLTSTDSPRTIKSRSGRSSNNQLESNELTDLVQVSTSFSVQLIPAPEKESRRIKRDSGSQNENKTLILKAPEDPKRLKRLLDDWDQQATRLRLTKISFRTELTADPEAQMQDRLELLRDQIQIRLNEEFLTNRIHRAAKTAALAAQRSEDGRHVAQESAQLPKTSGDLGLGLSQLVLDSGATRHKGSMYSTFEEAIELESQLDENSLPGSLSRLLKDTMRADKLRSHCKSSIMSVEQVRQSQVKSNQNSAKIELKYPFGATESSDLDNEKSRGSKRALKLMSNLMELNRRRLDQCTSVLKLLLQVNSRQAGDLVIDMIDECNQRLVTSSRFEELGYGPMSRYYRQVRRQFIELISNIKRPSEQQLDRLVTRLQQFDHNFHRPGEPTSGPKRKPPVSDQSTEFVYVSTGSNDGSKHNKTALRDEDDFNNHDGAALMLSTITTLASRPSISRVKRIQLIETLMSPMKNSTCSLLSGPDLDILESMGNIRTSLLDDAQPIDELVNRVVQVARRCKSNDHYTIACIHALQGQLRHRSSQRFLAEQLRSSNVSCGVKSEVVLALIGATLFDGSETLRPEQKPKDEREIALSWPRYGFNALDDLLLEMVELEPTKRDQKLRFEQDRACLRRLVAFYMSKKLTIPTQLTSTNATTTAVKPRRSSRGRISRAVKNEDQFWDEAECKRWSVGLNESGSSNSSLNFPASYDFIDALSPEFNRSQSSDSKTTYELDEDSVLAALAQDRLRSSSKFMTNGRSRNQKLIERESDWPPPSSFIDGSRNGSGRTNHSLDQTIRRRHKCSASKRLGPKNLEATLRAEVVNDLIGFRDENKFLARLSLMTNFLGKRINIGRMYLWHQRQMTRAHVNILGKNLWDSSHSCLDKAPYHLAYMPLFDLNLWLVKISVGVRLESEMGFFTECSKFYYMTNSSAGSKVEETNGRMLSSNDELQIFPTITVRASGEASARLVVARAGLSLASQYGYQGNIRVSRQPESCMSIESAHQPMNVTLSSWLQLWDSDCHFWGSRDRAQPQATRWRLNARRPTIWLDDECLADNSRSSDSPHKAQNSSSLSSPPSRHINP